MIQSEGKVTRPYVGKLSTWAIQSCRRCHRAFRARRAQGQQQYCTQYCARQERNESERARRDMQAQERYRTLARVPVHELWPGMLEVMALVQSWRPSYARWAG